MSTLNKFITGILIVSILFSLISAWGPTPLDAEAELICANNSSSAECEMSQVVALDANIKEALVPFLLFCITVLQVIYARYKYALELKQGGIKNSLTDKADCLTQSIDNAIYMLSSNRPFAPEEVPFGQARRYHIKPVQDVKSFFKYTSHYKRVIKDGQDILIKVDSN